jgi:hypothetical protein
MKRNATLDQIDAAINRVEARLFRAALALQKLRRQRVQKLRRKPPPAKTSVVTASPAETLVVTASSDLTIPAALDRRSQATKDADRARLMDLNAAETIKAELAERKKRKAAGQAARRKAKLSGETRQMPLTGKAALAAIREDKPGQS